jgi:hypothetical protein
MLRPGRPLMTPGGSFSAAWTEQSARAREGRGDLDLRLHRRGYRRAIGAGREATGPRGQAAHSRGQDTGARTARRKATDPSRHEDARPRRRAPDSDPCRKATNPSRHQDTRPPRKATRATNPGRDGIRSRSEEGTDTGPRRQRTRSRRRRDGSADRDNRHSGRCFARERCSPGWACADAELHRRRHRSARQRDDRHTPDTRPEPGRRCRGKACGHSTGGREGRPDRRRLGAPAREIVARPRGRDVGALALVRTGGHSGACIQ